MQRELKSDDSDARKFNHNLIQLIDQLGAIYPNDRDLFIYRDKMLLLTKANAKILADHFIYFCQDYIGQIMSKDIDFFLNFNYREGMPLVDEKYLKLIDKFIKYWIETTSESLRDTIWKYWQILLTYSIKCMGRRDLLPELNKYRKTPLIL